MPSLGALRRAVRRAVLPEWSSRNFVVVLTARVIMSSGRALAGIITPIYLALQGFSAIELAEYVMLVALLSAVFSTLIGLYSDQLGRRPFLIGVPLLAAGAATVFAFTGSTPVLFAMGALGSFGRGAGAGAGAVGPYQPAESAFVTEAIPPAGRNDAFGRLAFGSSLGATGGGLLALMDDHAHVHGAAAMVAFRPGFLAIAAVSVLAGLLAIWLVEPRRPPRAQGAKRPRVRWPGRSRTLLYKLWVTNTLNGMAVGMFGPFITYWFFRRFEVGPGRVGVLFAIINVVTMASTLSAASIARRIGVVKAVTIFRSIQAVLLVPMALAPSFEVAGGIYLVRMAVQRIGLPLRQSYAISQADRSERASVAALSNLPSQLAMAASPIFSGYLFDEVSLAAPFEISSVLQLGNALSFWGFFRNQPPEEERAAAAALKAQAAELAEQPDGLLALDELEQEPTSSE